jgi:hypothetical protein
MRGQGFQGDCSTGKSGGPGSYLQTGPTIPTKAWYVAAGTSIVGALSQPRCGDVLNLWREARFVLDGGTRAVTSFLSLPFYGL